MTQNLLADGGKERIEIEHGVPGEDSVPDVVPAHVLEASQVEEGVVLEPMEDGDLYYGLRLRGQRLAVAVFLRRRDETVIGIETFDPRPPIDLSTEERLKPEAPSDTEVTREALLEEMRKCFERALKSDCRALEDVLAWAPPLLPTTASNEVRLAVDNANPIWRQTGPEWVPVPEPVTSGPGQPTLQRTGAVTLFPNSRMPATHTP